MQERLYHRDDIRLSARPKMPPAPPIDQRPDDDTPEAWARAARAFAAKIQRQPMEEVQRQLGRGRDRGLKLWMLRRYWSERRNPDSGRVVFDSWMRVIVDYCLKHYKPPKRVAGVTAPLPPPAESFYVNEDQAEATRAMVAEAKRRLKSG